MVHDFDPGYPEPFAGLVRDYPGPEVYPAEDFRVEWGPVFHRGRLDGSARILALGQDPAAHEAIARRVLVGEAGQRVQGFLAKLGIEGSYVIANAFVYSVYGQGAGYRHLSDPGIVDYRHRWLDALFGRGGIDAVVTFGSLAKDALSLWQQDSSSDAVVANCYHPTYPEASSFGDPDKYPKAMRRMLGNWNEALGLLDSGLNQPDVTTTVVPYGEELEAGDVAPIPEADLPPGLPPWMRSLDPWAVREGEDEYDKRATIVVRVPSGQRPWPS